MDVLNAVKEKANYSSIVTYYQTKKDFSIEDLAVLIELINRMSEEIFEHYKALCEIFKNQVKKIQNELDLSEGAKPVMSRTECGVWKQTVKKACEAGILLKEKYEYLYQDIQ